MTMNEVNEAATIISQAADPDANIIFGATIDEKMTDQIKISVIGTGFDEERLKLSEFSARRPAIPWGTQPQPAVAAQADDTSQQQAASDQQQAADDDQGDGDGGKGQGQFDDEFDIPAFLRQGR